MRRLNVNIDNWSQAWQRHSHWLRKRSTPKYKMVIFPCRIFSIVCFKYLPPQVTHGIVLWRYNLIPAGSPIFLHGFNDNMEEGKVYTQSRGLDVTIRWSNWHLSLSSFRLLQLLSEIIHLTLLVIPTYMKF